jgi:hypothetical protein
MKGSLLDKVISIRPYIMNCIVTERDLRQWRQSPRVASAKMLPNGLVASGEMLPAIAPATMQPPLCGDVNRGSYVNSFRWTNIVTRK